MQRVALLQQGSVEIQFVSDPVVPTLSTWEIDIVEQEAWMAGADHAPLHIEALEARPSPAGPRCRLPADSVSTPL